MRLSLQILWRLCEGHNFSLDCNSFWDKKKKKRRENGLLYFLLTLYTQVDSSMNWFSDSWRKENQQLERRESKERHQPDENKVGAAGRLSVLFICNESTSRQSQQWAGAAKSILKTRRYGKRFLNENFSMSWSWLGEWTFYFVHWSGQIVTTTYRNEPNPQKIRK